MSELHWRILIGLIVAATIFVRLAYDRVYPQIIEGSKNRRRRLRIALTSLPVTGPILLQLAGIDILPMNPSDSMDFVVRAIGIILALFATVGLMWPRMMRLRRAVWSPPVTAPNSIPAHQLVTSGPYRHVRHPFYAACLLGVVAVELALASYLLLLLFPIAVIGLSIVARAEERNLELAYGEKYRQYMRRTWRFVPLVY